MYWTDWSDPPKLERASMDGSNRIVLVGNLGRVTGLTIDYIDKRIYWADIDKKVIESSDMRGRAILHKNLMWWCVLFCILLFHEYFIRHSYVLKVFIL